LNGVAAPELPVKAASLVAEAKAGEQQSVTMLVVRAVSETNPTALAAVVGAISHSTPAMAPLATASAAFLFPKQAVLFVRAAVGTAPDHAGQIVLATIQKLPAQYALIAAAAAEVHPPAGSEILSAVVTAVPSLKPYIEKTSASALMTDGNIPVKDILNQSAILARHDADSTTNSSTPQAKSDSSKAASPDIMAAGPVIGPPPVPLTVTPTEINPGDTVPQGPGGRNYSAP
ncbi:MAG: hypothetical protein ACTHLW_04345, partial [Verrucomicrobiota bacterium]